MPRVGLEDWVEATTTLTTIAATQPLTVKLSRVAGNNLAGRG